jgi:hypothetical protein
MKPSKAIGFGVAILFVALWAFPLARAFFLFQESQAYFAETGSINASNDLAFSRELLSSYEVSLLAAIAFAWVLSRRPHLLFLLPGVALVFAVVEVLRLRPESPIALIPTIKPWRPALISIVAATIGALFIYASRPNKNDRNG